MTVEDPRPTVVVRPLTAADDLVLERTGYERGDTLHPVGVVERPDALGRARHTYLVDTTNPLVVDSRVLLEQAGSAYRFLDANGESLTVRDLRRFRILVEVPS
ncbi:hypothetical protein [Cellulomonas sp. P5_C6]